MFDEEKAKRLMDIMFQEDEERQKNGLPLIYHTEEDFEEEKKERKGEN